MERVGAHRLPYPSDLQLHLHGDRAHQIVPTLFCDVEPVTRLPLLLRRQRCRLKGRACRQPAIVAERVVGNRFLGNGVSGIGVKVVTLSGLNRSRRLTIMRVRAPTLVIESTGENVKSVSAPSGRLLNLQITA
jgi:hypothetical protein